MKKKTKKKKKKKPFNYDPKKWPGFKRIVKIYAGPDTVCEIVVRGYIHHFESRLPYIHYTIYDPQKAFEPSKKSKVTWPKPDPKEFPNFIRRLHIFSDHECVAEIDIRGFLMSFVPIKTNVTIHTDHIVNYTGEFKRN